MKIKRIRRVALWSVAFLIAAMLIAVFLPVPPHGRFSTPKIANEADAYFAASGGKFTQVMFGGERGREGGEFRKFVGDYHKEHGRWVLVTDSGITAQLSATLLSLTIVYDKDHRDGPFYRYEIYTGR